MPENFDDVFVNAIAASIDGLTNGGEYARILVALSGGPDSTALLLAAHRLAEKSGLLILEAAHVNHHLRGKDSDLDEEFCREFCASLNIPLRVHQDDLATSTSSEDALRDKRYAFLKNEAVAGNFRAVMTAHTLNDQAETLLFRLIRGTSLKGLGGIRSCRNLVRDVLLLRPLLSISRDDVVLFLSQQEVTARDDLSNSQMHYSRNYIRHMIMKPIEERFVGGIERIAGFATRAAADDEFIEQQAQAIFAELDLFDDLWELNKIRGLHQSLFTRILVLALQQREIEVDSARIEALQTILLAEIGGRISLDGMWDAVVEGNHMQWLNKREDFASDSLPDFEVALKIPGVTPIADTGKGLSVELISGKSTSLMDNYPDANALEALVDFSRFQAESMVPITLRRRRVGDFIQPLGMTQNVRLKKYLHTRKASRQSTILDTTLEPGYLVSHCIVLASGKEVLWVPGIGLSEHVKVSANSEPTYRLVIVDLVEETD
ncbi:MAG: tRNA lysidine(34) synthetase TilS [Candidatus Obscuribacterales bacterium]|nr:tRNA lysidine(34) synthetase TilS [Candidatus Obscuribacterales bacterium]